MKSKEDNPDRVPLRGQLILAIIPSFVSQLIAFYRIKKVVYGIVIETAIFIIDFIIQLVVSWPLGMVFSLPLTIGIPVYYVRKWTLEYNAISKGIV